METTLLEIEKYQPCQSSWNKLLKHLGKTEPDDEPIEILDIIEVLGIQDAIWSFRAVDGWKKEKLLFIADCAEHVLHIYEKKYPKDKRPRKAIKATRLFANGKISKEKLKTTAAADAYAAAADAYATAFNDAYADVAAAAAAYAAADADAYATAAAAAYAAAAYAAFTDAAAYAADDAAVRQKELDWQKQRLIEIIRRKK